jgi:uncharacterized protein with ATP-grasp and redox domains
MKIQRECVPCLLKRILFEAEQSTDDEARQTKALRTACRLLSELYDPRECSASIATQVHDQVYEVLGDRDPYKQLKETGTRVALSLLPKVEECVASSEDPLRASIVCAIIGNILDFGIEGGSVHPKELEEVFDRLYAEGLGYDEYPVLRQLLAGAHRCVVCTDNCGEIVFDKVMCRELKRLNPGLRVSALVKGAPVLTDATAADAAAIGFGEVVDEVFDTGCFCVGVDFRRLPARPRGALEQADVIVCKGMANFESFSETSYRPVAYLLRTKCQAIADAMGLPRGISVVKVYR